MSSPAAVSPLTNKLVPNPNYSKYADRNGGRPEFVVPHHAAGTGSAENIILYDKRIGLSTHYAVDRNTIANAVSEIHGSYSAGNTEWNKKSVSFEMSNDGGAATNWHIHEGTVENAALLTADILVRWGLGKPVHGGNVRFHREIVATACPGPYFWGIVPAFIDRVAQLYAKGGAALPVPVPVPVPEPVPESPGKRPVLRAGSSGAHVEALQGLVNAAYHMEALTVDGLFGPATKLAVMQFQKDRGLAVDGAVGPATWASLER